MATRVYGAWSNVQGSPGGTLKVRAWLEYSILVDSATLYRVSVYPGFDIIGASGKAHGNLDVDGTITATDKSDVSRSRSFSAYKTTGNSVSYQLSEAWSYDWTKQKSSYSVNIANMVIMTGDWISSTGVSTASLKLIIPTKDNYLVTYNARTGTGAPASQTKYYGESLTLSTVRPTKAGYTFLGWATSEAIAKTGTVNYAPGASYTGNAALSLQAVWELTYQKPTISNLSIERCLQDGTVEDEGTYAKVAFDWSVFQNSAQKFYGGSGNSPYASNTAGSCVITIDSTDHQVSNITNPVSEVIAGPFSTDSQYPVSVTFSDSQTEKTTGNTITVNGILASTYFPMDFNADATAVGFFQPAPDDDEGMFIGKDLHIKGDLVADYVVDQGTTNGWDWVKYASGRYEAERIHNFGQVTIGTGIITISGSVRLYGSALFPSTIPSPPHTLTAGSVMVDFYGATGGNPILVRQGDQIRLCAIATASTTVQDTTLLYRVVNGRWK